MPIKFGPGERVKSAIDTYVVESLDDVLSQGAFAHAAKARSASRGEPVFLKRYFSPTRALDWYDGFVQHQQELKRRITTHAGLSQYCYGFLDFFEGTEGRANKTFHQVFEFVKNGKSLAQYLLELAPEGPLPQWDRRVSFARVMMMGIAALHEQRIVHTDLKPDNILLVPNPVRADVYNLKLIDLDWAIFSDRTAPWHGKGLGYVGTHGYMSPEHLNGEVPIEKSDTYTCALMLAELLTGEHPFAGKLGDDTVLRQAALKGDFRPFKLPTSINKVDNPLHLEGLINQALHPSPSERPSSADIKNALFGRGEAGESAPPPPSPAPPAPSPVPITPPTPAPVPKPDATPSPAPAPAASAKTGVELQLNGKVALRINIDTTVGRQMLKPVHADAQFLADAQFRLQRSASGEWTVSPMPSTINETLVDGKRLEGAATLRNGMRIAVGNSAKGVEKLPLVVRIS